MTGGWQAPLGEIERKRRPLRVGHVLVTIQDLLIVTWRIPAAQLQSHLPPNLRPVVLGGDAVVSAVIFRNYALRPAVVGVPRIHACQMNLRSYVLDPATGIPGSVFFHGLYLSRRWVARVSSWIFGVPFQYVPLTLAVTRVGDDLSVWEARSTHGIMVRAIGADTGMDVGTLELLTNPHTAYVLDRRGLLRTWSIWHRPQTVHVADVQQAPEHIEPFNLPGRASALYVSSVDYEVYWPPQVMSFPSGLQWPVTPC